MAVKEQQRAEIDFRRSIARHRALRMFATGGVIGAAFAFCATLMLAPVDAWRPGILLAFIALLAARERRKLSRLRAAAVRDARLFGVGWPRQTHAEAAAEAIEGLRQRQWDLITERAFLARGGRARSPIPALPPAVPAPSTARPPANAVRLDPRWEWTLIQGLGVPDVWVKARCLHTEVIPVESVTGDVVAQLCLTCDTPFPAPRERGALDG